MRKGTGVRQRVYPLVLGMALFAPGCNGGGGARHGAFDSIPTSHAQMMLTESTVAAQSPRREQFPATHAGIHLNLVFNYGVRDLNREIGLIDVVWGASSPKPPQIYNQFYTPFEREGIYRAPYIHSLAWWQQHHPDWIEYRCDRTTVAFEFGDKRDVPLDIANPRFQQFQRSGSVDPALAAGYRGIDFDNLSLDNYSERCGHFAGGKKWIAQYSGQYADPIYAADVTAWSRSTFGYIHSYSPTATMAINYSYQSDFSFEKNLDLMKQTDEVLDEGGYTQYGSGPHVTTPRQWSHITSAIAALQANKTCYMENGEEPPPSLQITQPERLWVVANYLLTRDDCTYVWMSGFSPHGSQQYGKIHLYPEYGLNVGAPAASMIAVGNGWKRRYETALVLVNPSQRSQTFTLDRTYYDENGNVLRTAVELPKTSGQILLSSPPRQARETRTRPSKMLP